MKKLIFAGIVLIFAFSSCCDEEKNVEKEVLIQKDSSEISNSEHLSMATLWFQKSAEAKAVYYQTFNFAKTVFDGKIKKDRFKLKKKKPKAIITDIDETILNNSPYEARLIETGTSYNEKSWSKWVNEKQAKALPGAVNFMNYVKGKGVDVFYISNRNVKYLQATLENLKKVGFPFADETHILLKDKTSDKSARRDSVLKNYKVILYLGDNLRDFDENFKYAKNMNRNDSVAKYKDLFGAEYIVFPNPMYGEWEKAVYESDFSKSDNEKRKMRIDALNKK
ncbi:MAG: 5'-nucleotidase, lipoprotein e(P4) family [Bacteroidales bacterium]|nr:5'-nucleotidase, lipoprotein e(P4) family [Bacteroidales bacterium]